MNWKSLPGIVVLTKDELEINPEKALLNFSKLMWYKSYFDLLCIVEYFKREGAKFPDGLEEEIKSKIKENS